MGGDRPIFGGSFNAYCNRCGLTAEGKEYIRRARLDLISESCARVIFPNGYPSKKTERTVCIGDSTYDLAHVYEREFSRKVIAYYLLLPVLRFLDPCPNGRQALIATCPGLLRLDADQRPRQQQGDDGATRERERSPPRRLD